MHRSQPDPQIHPHHRRGGHASDQALLCPHHTRVHPRPADHGYWTLLFDIADETEVNQTLPMALQYQVDGVVITSATLSSKLADEFARTGTPVVLFNRYASTRQTHVVRCDNYAGGRRWRMLS